MPMGTALAEVRVESGPAEIAALARRARDGDTNAYEVLYRLHVGRVYAVCLRLSGDSVRAKEMAQEAFVQAWRQLGQLRDDQAFSPWLHRITANVALMGLRRRGRLWAREAGSETLEALAQVRGGGAEPVGERIDLERAIARLPQQARAVLVLHDIEGYQHEEIAALLRIAAGTSKAHLHRARRALREVLGS
jgi:RNA polymerase sigma-70 factor, ECF subfamily